MKWFRHFTKALTDPKIEKLIMRHGIEGYGLYFACLEIIAGNLTSDNITFELEHDAEILAYKFKIDTLRVESIMKSCIELGLFEYSKVSKRIQCIKMLDYIDESSAKNPEIKKIVSTYNEAKKLEPIIEGSCQNSDNSGNIRETFGNFPKPSEQIRLDEIRLDKKEITQEPPIGDASASDDQAIAPLPTKKKKRHKDADWYTDEINLERLEYVTGFFKTNTDFAVTKETRHYLKDIVDNFTNHDDNTFMDDDFVTAFYKYKDTKDKYWSQGKRHFVGFYKSIGMV